MRFGGAGGSDTYVWGDRQISFHRCQTCGSMTHWRDIDPTGDRIGINTRMMDAEALQAATVRQSPGPK